MDNNDPFFHTFTVDGLDIDEEFIGGSSKIVEIPKKPGECILYCKPHITDTETRVGTTWQPGSPLPNAQIG